MAATKFRKREWIVITIGVTVLFAIGVLPFLQKAHRAYAASHQRVEQAQYRLQTAQELRALIEDERSGQEAVKRRLMARPGTFNLYAYTARALQDLNLYQRANLLNNPPRTGGTLDGVQVDINGISMNELIDFLYRMYDGNNLIVLQKLDELKPARDGNGLECRMTFITPRA